MKNISRTLFTAVAILSLIVFASACRTKTKVKPQPTPPPVTTDTAPAVEPEPVQSTTEDFVREQPAVESEELSGDINELNRTAQEKGWIRDAFFAYDASTLDSGAQDALSASATWLKAHPDYNLLVEGHCDERGTEQYNLALGDKRANTARDYLMTLGIDGSRLKTVSYGEEKPFAAGHDESSWQQNRRAHLVLTK